MAFLPLPERRSRERFSLLLLDPGEIYYEDFSVFHYPKDLSQRKREGRLKICSRSLVFDPDEHQYPITKFPFKFITEISQQNHLETNEILLRIKSSESILMKEHNRIKPYQFLKEDQCFDFSFVYVSYDSVVPLMEQLKRASTLPQNDSSAMINAITTSRKARIPFDMSWLDSFKEDILMETVGDRVSPLICNPGRIMLTSAKLYFQPFNNIDPRPVVKIDLKEIDLLIKRRFLLKNIGLHISCPHNRDCVHMYLSFENQTLRDQMYDSLVAIKDVKLKEIYPENMMLKWQRGALSNAAYLTYLNSLADRSTFDLTQYPVFPWVIADQTSKQLDLKNPATFRDLSKPIGTLNAERFEKLKKRFDELPEKPFLYGSHYSSPGYVLFYLARVAPEYVLCLQNGRFDYPDRMFNSIEKAWKNCMESTTDFKELIPEFYGTDPEFLEFNPLLDFGYCVNGQAVRGVELPPWATDAKDYLNKLREALESDYVADNLHHWIDLIFGYKQRGDEAVKANNVFYHLTYEGAVNLDEIDDPSERASLEAQIMEFGQTPKQLFTKPHPKKTDLVEIFNDSSALSQGCNLSGSSISRAAHFVPNIGTDLEFVHQYKLHKSAVKYVYLSDKQTVFSTSTDGSIKVYNLKERKQRQSVTPTRQVIECCLVMPDEAIVILACDNTLIIYSLCYGRTLDEVCVHDNTVTSLAMNDKYMISASLDATIKLWTVEMVEDAPNISLKGEFDHDTGILCSSLNNEMVACGTEDGSIYVWNLEHQLEESKINAHTDKVTAIQFNYNGSQILSAGFDCMVNVFDTKTSTLVYNIKMDHPIGSVLWDSRHALVGDSKANIHIFDLVNGSIIKTIRQQEHQSIIHCLSVNNHGQVVSGDGQGLVCVWNTHKDTKLSQGECD